MQHVFIVGSKSIGQYGGYETFIYKLLEYSKDNKDIKYHIACKDSGDGYMDESKLENVEHIKENEFEYNNAHCFKIKVPSIGPAVAIYYDLAALNYCLKYIKENHIEKPIIYILACRIGPFMKYYYDLIHKLNGKLFINPDGHEWLRSKWNKYIKKYWKLSERLMVKNSDLVICDSLNIEKYILNEYKKYNPKTRYISYGSETRKSLLKDNDESFIKFKKNFNIKDHNYYLIVGRFVPENNYETMIKEFMKSKTDKDLVIITNINNSFYELLKEKTAFDLDSRIKFVGTIYNEELLKKIRENAYAYLHGHEVGGTNPSLLEALGSTDLNLLLDVGFNKEVGEDACLYWTKEKDNLANLINKTDLTNIEEIKEYSLKAKQRINDNYSWGKIVKEYGEIFR